MGNHAVFDMLDQRRVDRGKRTGGQSQIPEPHLCQRTHHLVHHMVAAPEVVVEGDGHAVLQAGGPDGVLQGGQDFILLPRPVLERLRILLRHAAERAPVCDLADMGDALQQFFIYHRSTPPLTRCPLPPGQ